MAMTRKIPTGMALLCCAMLVAAAVWEPVKAKAQASGGEEATYTYVALWGVPRPQWGDIEKFYKEAQPELNKLVADGTVLAWGNARNFTHDERGMTHANWITATSFANIRRGLDAIHAALPQPAAFSSSKHEDLMLRSTIHGANPGASGSGMLWVAHYRVRQGQMDTFTQLFASEIQPLFAEQMAAGNILGYSLDFQAIHTEEPGGVDIAYLLPDAAAIDKFQAALAAYETKHPEAGPAIEATMDYGVHRDYVYEVISFAQK
jgi:hypothetical protein